MSILGDQISSLKITFYLSFFVLKEKFVRLVSIKPSQEADNIENIERKCEVKFIFIEIQ